MTAKATTRKPGSGGHNRKSVEQLQQEGTFRADRHADRLPADTATIKTRPASRSATKCGNPAKWVRNPGDERAIANGCYFDEHRAAFVVDWFRRYLRHSKAGWAGKPFELLDWQRDDVIYPLFGWLRADGKRRFRKSYIQIPKKNGKALACDTPIATPTGWSMMGDLRPGDQVFDDNGLPCNVVAVSETWTERPCIELEFSDGQKIVADVAHEWLTHSLKRERCGIWETSEIAETLRCGSGNNHSIPVAAGLQLPCAALPIDPYVLGVWLGDGHSASARVTYGDADMELVGHIVACGVPVKRRESGHAGTALLLLGSGNRSQAARDKSIQATLRKLGLINNKHIPPAYLRGAYSQRMSLLQGLMDTDGYCSKAGQCEFTTTSEALRDGAMELLRSLGFKPTLKTARATIYGRDCGEKYRIQFWAFADCPVFRLERKAARQKKAPERKRRSTTRQIVAANRVASVPVRCIQVDSPSRLFLAGRSMIPTHNSTLASGVGLYMLCGDGEMGAEVYSSATDKDQASIVHREAINMAEASEALMAALKINRTTRNIHYDKARSFYRVLSNRPQGSEGLNGNCSIVDELHAWRGRELWDSLKFMGRSRAEPLGFVITTAGDDVDTVCYEQYQYAKRLLSGADFDDRFFAYVREIDPDKDDFTDPEIAAKANPSFGITIDPQDFAADVEEARQTPSGMASMLRYSFNVWATQTNAWLSLDHWTACKEEFTYDDLRGRECFMGLDLSHTRDTTAVVLAFPPTEDEDPEAVKLLPFFWLPKERAYEYDKLTNNLFSTWGERGFLNLQDSPVIDHAMLRADIVRLCQDFNVLSIAYDPMYAESLTQELCEETGAGRVDFKQTIMNFCGPVAGFERLVIAGKMQHNGQPLLSWQAGHCQVYSDANNNKRPVKPPGKDHRKIDGMVAAIMAYALHWKQISSGSYYDDHELESA